MDVVSAISTHEDAGPPYRVVQQTHSHTFRPDGTQGGQYTVHIHHRNGVRTQFTIPEEHYSPENVHAVAMHQVNQVQAVAELPHSLGQSQ
jgi:hypothetical protein